MVLDRGHCSILLSKHLHPVTVKKVRSFPQGVVYEGRFNSPLTTLAPGVLPKESEVARFEMILPHNWKTMAKPIYIHLAGTGDHYFWRRRNLLCIPTLKEHNIGAVLLENPFYGSRKPRDQVRSQLHHVSDLFAMGLSLILECMLLLHWLEGTGFGPVGLTGISMGGHNASLAAAMWPKEVPAVPCLSWATASSVFTEGILSHAVCWDALETQLFYSRIGHDEGRRRAFRQVLEKMEKSCETRTGCTAAHIAAAAHSLGLSVGEKAHVGGLGHWETVVDAQTRTEQSTSAQGRDLFTDTDMGESCKKPGQLLGSVEPRNGDSSLSESPEQVRTINSRALGQQLKASVGITKTKSKKRKKRKFTPKEETVEMMRMILDFATHLGMFPSPLAPHLATFVVAKDDLYIPRQSVTDVRSIWSGCEVRYMEGGHVSSAIFQQGHFRSALADAMSKVLETSTSPV